MATCTVCSGSTHKSIVAQQPNYVKIRLCFHLYHGLDTPYDLTDRKYPAQYITQGIY